MKSILTKAMLVAATTLSYVGCEESTPEKNPPEVTPIVEISTFDDKPHSDPNGQRWNVGDGIVLIDYIPEGTNFQLEHRDRVHDITQQPVINSDAGLALGTGPEVISDYSISQRDAGVPDSRTEDSQLPDAAILDAETLDVLVDAALPTARDLHEEGACMTTSSFEALGSNPDSSNAAYRILLHADQSRMGYGMPIVNGEANSFRLLDRNLQASLYLGVPIFWDGESANFGTLLNRESRNGERVAIQNFEWTMQGENYCDRRTSITSLEQARWCINQDPARFELYDENCNEDDILPDEEPALPVIPDVGVPIEVDAAIPELFSGLEFEGTLRYEDGEPVYTIVWDFGPDNRRREEGNQIFTPENVESMRRIIDLSLGVAYKLTWGDDWQEQMEDPFIRSFADPIRIGMNTEGTCGNNRQSHPGIGTTVLCTSPEHFISDDAAPTHGIITHEGEHIANAMNARPYFMREFTAVVVAGYAHTRVTNQEVLNLPFEELIDQEPPRRDFSYDNELWKKWENRTNGRRYGVADQGAHLFSQLSRRFGFTPVTNLAVQDAMLERFREINNNQIQADMAPVPLAEYLAIMIETLRIEDENQFIEVFHENGVPPSELHPTRPGIHPKEALYSPRSGNVIFSLFNGTQEERRYEVRIEGCIIPEARNDLVNLTATELNQIADIEQICDNELEFLVIRETTIQRFREGYVLSPGIGGNNPVAGIDDNVLLKYTFIDARNGERIQMYGAVHLAEHNADLSVDSAYTLIIATRRGNCDIRIPLRNDGSMDAENVNYRLTVAHENENGWDEQEMQGVVPELRADIPYTMVVDCAAFPERLNQGERVRVDVELEHGGELYNYNTNNDPLYRTDNPGTNGSFLLSVNRIR